MISKLRGFLRLLFFIVGSLFYMSRYLIKVIFVGHDLHRSLHLLSEWTRILMKGLGLTIEVVGTIPEQAGLLICNHRSYVDPFLLFGSVPAVPVGKAAVAKWPLIGQAGKLAGAVFIDRASPESRQASRQAIAERLQNGFFVINYAEGTTHTNPQTIDFKPGLFKDAAISQFLIYPVALDYQLDKDAWVGDDVFIRHFLECFGKKNTSAKVYIGPPIKNTDANNLLNDTKNWIDNALLEMRKDWPRDNRVASVDELNKRR